MSQMLKTAHEQIRAGLAAALSAAVAAGELPQAPLPAFDIEVPADREHGDLSANAALVSAKTFRTAPRRIADILMRYFSTQGTCFAKAEVAGPGFLNFYLDSSFYGGAVAEILEKGADYGRSDYGRGRKVKVEFVSANPTGPMHMGNARGGALGDCLAAVLDAAGYRVWREFYINDAGNQIEKFALSLDVRYLQKYLGEDAPELPEDAYHGDDIRQHAEDFAAVYGDRYVRADEAQRREALVRFALPRNIERMQRDLEKYRIVYDEWFRESSLHRSGEVAQVIDILRQKGLTYEQDGALWYKNKQVLTEQLLAQGKTQAEIDRLELKDDVLVRANGNPTYFAADIAYHRNKFLRGFERCIDVWGADHHGHVARMKGAMDAIGMDGSRLDVVLIQLVRLMQNGEVVRMSKRSGKAIQLADLLDEVPVDAARFFFNLREAGVRMDFDLDLAIEQSASNPVYYVQYAHARICSIFRRLAQDGVELRPCTAAQLACLTAPEEKELIRQMAGLEEEIIGAAREYDPARMTRYAGDLATLFHKFYNACRVQCDDEQLTQARLALCAAVRIVLRNVLTLLKISAPETM
ncbi:MAG: arginine--tRNA ligase [Clostridia bacterium]|nr:arginine--tRNA ligase [Clostridia bacterium]